jgi:hypothetical protein
MCVYVIMLIFVCFLCYYVYSVKSLCLLLYKNRIQIKFSYLILSYLILSYLILSYLSRGGYILNLHFGRDAICVSGAFLHIKSHYTLMTISQIPTFNPIRFPILTTVGYLVGCQCNTRPYFISEKKCNVRDGIRSQAYSHCKLQ